MVRSIMHADYKKKPLLPQGFTAPRELQYEMIEASPLMRSDLLEDIEAVNGSIGIIRSTRGGSWPEGPMDEDYDFLDLAWHEREFRESSSFAYAVRCEGKYIGCFYIYPIGERTSLSDETERYDADVSWWVTQQAYDNGQYVILFNALNQWMKLFPFSHILYSNKIIPEPGGNI